MKQQISRPTSTTCTIGTIGSITLALHIIDFIYTKTEMLYTSQIIRLCPDDIISKYDNRSVVIATDN